MSWVILENWVGWAVVKQYQVDDSKKLKYVKELTKLDADFERKGTVGKGGWQNIQGLKESQMQFEELHVCHPTQKWLYKQFSGSRYMKYMYNKEENADMKRRFPVLYSLFDGNNDVCAKYLGSVSSIECQYISGGCNFLVNYQGVLEQKLHSDYDREGYDGQAKMASLD